MYRNIGLNGFTDWFGQFSAVATKWKIAAGLLFASLIFVPVQSASALLIEFGCSPSSTTWTTEGAWSGGTVMESRTCLEEDTAQGKLRTHSYWRTRNGGTPVLSDWNLDPDAVAYIWVTYPSSFSVGNRSNFIDKFDTSFVELTSNWGCTNTGNTLVDFQGKIKNVQANPNGTTLGASGFKNADSQFWRSSVIAC